MNRSQERAAEIDGWFPTVDDKIEICGCGKEMVGVRDCFDMTCFECRTDDWHDAPFDVGEKERLLEKYRVGVV